MSAFLHKEFLSDTQEGNNASQAAAAMNNISPLMQQALY
jgi:hypothetical protein